MTDLTKELNRSQGIPFLEYKQFVTRTFFPKVRKTFFPPLSDSHRRAVFSHFTLFPTACNKQGIKPAADT